jgi:hypothetical protein
VVVVVQCGFRKFCRSNSGYSGRLRWCLGSRVLVQHEVARSDGGPVELVVPAPLEDAVDDRGREVVVVQDVAPGVRLLVRREDHRSPSQMAFVHDVEEHVRGVESVREVAHLVDQQDAGSRVRGERFAHPTLAARPRQIVDERRERDEEGVGAVLDRPIADRDCEVRLPAPGLSGQDEAASFRDEVRSEKRAQELETKRRLMREVEVVDRLQEGEVSLPREPLETSFLTMSDLLREKHREEVAEGPLFLLGSSDEIAPDPPRVGEVEALQNPLDVDLGEVHLVTAPLEAANSGAASTKCATYSAP